MYVKVHTLLEMISLAKVLSFWRKGLYRVKTPGRREGGKEEGSKEKNDRYSNTRKTEGRFSTSLPPELLDYKPLRLCCTTIIGHGESSRRPGSTSANRYF